MSGDWVLMIYVCRTAESEVFFRGTEVTCTGTMNVTRWSPWHVSEPSSPRTGTCMCRSAGSSPDPQSGLDPRGRGRSGFARAGLRASRRRGRKMGGNRFGLLGLLEDAAPSEISPQGAIAKDQPLRGSLPGVYRLEGWAAGRGDGGRGVGRHRSTVTTEEEAHPCPRRGGPKVLAKPLDRCQTATDASTRFVVAVAKVCFFGETAIATGPRHSGMLDQPCEALMSAPDFPPCLVTRPPIVRRLICVSGKWKYQGSLLAIPGTT
jgi:hypothetical protein